jgi:hypothetical protein
MTLKREWGYVEGGETMGELKGKVYMNIPLKWNIIVERQPNEEYKFTYIEVVEKPEWMSEEDFKRAAEGSIEIVRDTMKRININGEVNVKLQNGKCIIELHETGTLEHAASFITSEFMPFSRLGNLTLKELFLYSLAGIFGMEKFEKAVVVKPQPIETTKEAILIRNPEKISEKPERWVLYCSSEEEWLYPFVTREKCPEIESLRKGDRVIVKLRGNEVVKVEKVKGGVGKQCSSHSYSLQ